MLIGVVMVGGCGLKEVKVKRKTFVAREDLINRLSEFSEQRGYSLYALVNEVLELAIKAEEAGVDLKRVVEEYRAVKAAREAGFILTLERLWYDMADLVYEQAKDEALKGWFDVGAWFAKRYVALGGKVGESFRAFVKDLEAFVWNVSEFTVETVKGKVYVRLVSPRFTEAYTYLFRAFIGGALDAFGYRVVEEEVGRGIMRLEAVGKEADEKR